MKSYSVCLSLAFHLALSPRGPSMLSQMADVLLSQGWRVFHCVSTQPLWFVLAQDRNGHSLTWLGREVAQAPIPKANLFPPLPPLSSFLCLYLIKGWKLGGVGYGPLQVVWPCQRGKVGDETGQEQGLAAPGAGAHGAGPPNCSLVSPVSTVVWILIVADKCHLWLMWFWWWIHSEGETNRG